MPALQRLRERITGGWVIHADSPLGDDHTLCGYAYEGSAIDHLEPVLNEENIRRGEGGINNRVKTHCPKGHPYDAANTYVSKKGYRNCRACNRAKDRARRERRGYW